MKWKFCDLPTTLEAICLKLLDFVDFWGKMCQNAERIELVCRNRICGYVQQTSPGLHYIKGIGVTPKISVLLPETLAKTKNFASFGYFITQMALLRVKGCWRHQAQDFVYCSTVTTALGDAAQPLPGRPIFGKRLLLYSFQTHEFVRLHIGTSPSSALWLHFN